MSLQKNNQTYVRIKHIPVSDKLSNCIISSKHDFDEIVNWVKSQTTNWSIKEIKEKFQGRSENTIKTKHFSATPRTNGNYQIYCKHNNIVICTGPLSIVEESLRVCNAAYDNKINLSVIRDVVIQHHGLRSRNFTPLNTKAECDYLYSSWLGVPVPKPNHQITINDECYSLLNKLTKDDESYSDSIIRLNKDNKDLEFELGMAYLRCPKCGRTLKLKTNHGTGQKFVACSGYKLTPTGRRSKNSCNYTTSVDETYKRLIKLGKI